MYSRARGVSRASAKWRSAEALLDWKEWGSICEWVAPANWLRLSPFLSETPTSAV